MDIQLLYQVEDATFICNHCIKQLEPECDGGSLYDEHYHQFYEILFVRSGNISHCINNEKFRVSANSLVFIRPGVVHSICMGAESIYDRFDLLIAPTPAIQPLLQQIPENLHVLDVSSHPILLQLFDRLDYYCRTLRAEEQTQITNTLITELLFNIVLICRDSDRSNPATTSALLQQVLTHIDGNLLKITDIDCLCADLGISKSNLHRMFTKELQSTPKRYITERKLIMAQWEISSGSKASAIYEKYGFTDYSAFFRAYRKLFGYAPSDTRQSAFQNARK